MTNNHIPTHPTIEDKIRQSFHRGSLSHAIILEGKSGYGSLNIAQNISQLLLCASDNERPCGSCKSCRLVENNTHPDLHFVYPVIKSGESSSKSTVSSDYIKQWQALRSENPFFDLGDWMTYLNSENKQANIGVAECKAIVHKMSLASFAGGNRVLIIWMAEYLNKEGNRLLKLIEEPPSGTYIFLITENSKFLLNTIRSRCQLIRVPRFDDSQVEYFLENRYQLNKDAVPHIVRVADGNMGTAIHTYENQNADLALLFKNWMRSCFLSSGKQQIDQVTKVAGLSKEGQKAFIMYALAFYREYTEYYFTGNINLKLNPLEVETVKKLRPRMGYNEICEVNSILNEVLTGIKRNGNIKYLMLDATIKINSTLEKYKQLQKIA